MTQSLRAFLCVFIALLAMARLDAQVLYGSIVGTVQDASGAAVPGAKVTATNKATGQQREATANDAGNYNFVAVQPGEYEVKVSREGFKSGVESNVNVTANSTVRVDMSLTVGQVNESVTIEASAAVLQTDSAVVKSEVTNKDLINIPTPVGRNYQNLLVTIPGVAPPQNAHSVPTNPSRALQFNVNGAPAAGNNIRIDGASSIQVWLPHIAAYVPSLEAIETVNVVTNSFSAEQGLAGGAAINVQIKSGTNDLHGSGFWYHNSNAMLAKPFTFMLLQQNQRNPKYIFNQPGGTIGGRIIKNKLFYFAAYELSTRREFANNTATLPTANMRAGNFADGESIFGARGVIFDPNTGDPNTGAGRTPFAGNIIPSSRISPIALAIQQKIPGVSETTFRDNNYFATGGFLFDRKTLDTKVNYNINEKWTAYGRYSILNYKMNNPGMLGEIVGPGISNAGGNTGTANGTTHSTTIASTYVIRPNLIIDANFGYTLYQTAVEQPFLDQNIGKDVLKIPGTNGSRRFEGGWPRFQYSGFTTLGVPDSFMPYTRRDPQYQYVFNVNWTKGRHQFRYGIDFYKQDLNHLQAEFAGQNQGAQGGFSFTGGPTQLRGGAAASSYNTWASFLLGLPNSYGTTLQVPDEYGTRTMLYSAYFQDTWQVNPKLTINIGTRYENIPMPRRQGRGMERYDFTNNKMLVCGVGNVPTDCGTKNSNLLFSPRVGIAYRPNDKTVIRTGFGINWDPLNLIRALRTNYPLLIILNGNAPDAFVPVSNIAQGIPSAPVPNIGNGVLDMPATYALTSTGDRFRRAYIMSWNFTVQRQIWGGFTAQAGYVANRTVRQTNFLDLNAGQVIGAGQNGRPFFPTFRRNVQTALVDSLGHTVYDSLQLSAVKRMSSGLTWNLAYTWSKALGVCCNTNNDGGPTIQALQYMGLARALSPFDRPHNFQTTMVWELPFGKGKPFLSTGMASKLLGGWQINNLMSAYTGAPFTVGADGASLNLPGSSQRADLVGPVNRLGSTGRNQAFFDYRAFRNVTEQRFGTAGFNILRGPHIFNWDAGLFRRFNINERVNIQFRAELANVLNTPQLGNPSSGIQGLRTNANGDFLGGVFEVTGVANTGRDGIVQRAGRLGIRIGF